MDLCQSVFGTNLQNVLENVCGHKSLQFLSTFEICSINGAQTLMDLQYKLVLLLIVAMVTLCLGK